MTKIISETNLSRDNPLSKDQQETLALMRQLEIQFTATYDKGWWSGWVTGAYYGILFGAVVTTIVATIATSN